MKTLQTLSTAYSNITSPSYYSRYQIEPLEFIAKNKIVGTHAAALKYVLRAGNKPYSGKSYAESAIIDLEKAITYLCAEGNYTEGKVTMYNTKAFKVTLQDFLEWNHLSYEIRDIIKAIILDKRTQYPFTTENHSYAVALIYAEIADWEKIRDDE